jgi:hypothetical protein
MLLFVGILRVGGNSGAVLCFFCFFVRCSVLCFRAVAFRYQALCVMSSLVSGMALV